MSDDADLVARSRQRDAAAFGVLVDRHHRLVFAVALATCGDASLAEDVVQDAFVTAWRDLDRLRDANRIGPWIAGIARNLAALALRQRARGTRLRDDVDGVRTPEDDALDREDRELLRRALARLHEAQREALVLYYLEGQSIARIATTLQIRDDVVKQRLSRGRKALRDSFVRVEAALTRVRPRAATPALVLAALPALGGRKAMAAPGALGKVIATMKVSTKLGIAAVATLVLATGAAWVGTHARGDARDDARSDHDRTAAERDRARDGEASSQRVQVRRMQDVARRAQLLAAINRAAAERKRSASSTAAASASSSSPAAQQSNDEYVGQALAGIIPLVEECFRQGVARNPKLNACPRRPPTQQGDGPVFDMDCQVFVAMTIEGEPSVGGLVTDTAIDTARSDVRDPETVQCLEETIYSLEIGPPPRGGALEAAFEIKLGMDLPSDAG